MFQEKTGIAVENIVILVAVENGTNQVFVKKPIEYVKGLYKDIKLFDEDNQSI